MNISVTYEFRAFPVVDFGKHPNGKKRLRWSPLSVFSFDRLSDAKKEIARLKKNYRVEQRKRENDPNGPANLLTGYQDHYPDYLSIIKVVRTPIEEEK